MVMQRRLCMGLCMREAGDFSDDVPKKPPAIPGTESAGGLQRIRQGHSEYTFFTDAVTFFHRPYVVQIRHRLSLLPGELAGRTGNIAEILLPAATVRVRNAELFDAGVHRLRSRLHTPFLPSARHSAVLETTSPAVLLARTVPYWSKNGNTRYLWVK